jgi:hypothetical protein
MGGTDKDQYRKIDGRSRLSRKQLIHDIAGDMR